MKYRTLNQLLKFDRKFVQQSGGLIAGIDEAGRGPLAGPVVAAAVILFSYSPFFVFLNDSKKVLPHVRETLFREIAGCALVGVGFVEESLIDELNIYQATRLAMKRAVLSLTRSPDLLLIDGTMKIDVPLAQHSIIGGDQKSAAIAAASILAKVCRDAWMTYLDKIYPAYEFKHHKGYGTLKHLERIREHGPSPVHRKSFAPVHSLLEPNLL